MKNKSKIIIFSAPSGSGKTTIIREMLNKTELNLRFSISACSRKIRDNEQNGVDYYFFGVDEFKNKILNNDFLEWEEVYENNYYGSLKSEVERLSKLHKNVVFDVDVKGGINIKNFYKDQALSIFIMPPNIEELEQRLRLRSTDNDSAIKMRVEKAKYEMSFANQFDKIIINDNLETALKQSEEIISKFINK